MTTAYSHLAGRDVDTRSEDWRFECECRWLLTAKPTRTEKHMHLYGVADRNALITHDVKGRQVLRADHAHIWMTKSPLMKHRGLEGADRLLAGARKLHDLTVATA